ncbi:origin recognition complex subunit 2-domain-containing protein [Ephemerocybe angulata]|uniref:Origin recognition complex subunit 2 n=1 Tax=Ephemerocybe angulata TaxID=980116 RepID=A0A8H6HH16_9AGAR|nr:origin recognition complex subunit 2-domain-containing protein [Tulosesus angulatus]
MPLTRLLFTFNTMRSQRAFDVVEESSGSSEDEDIEMNDVSDEESEGELPQTPSKRTGKGRIGAEHGETNKNIIQETAFDAYFTYSASKIQTSGNVFSDLLLPLSAEEYAEGIASASKHAVKPTTSILEEDKLKSLFSRFIFEMSQGFNLLCYGFGSKRQVLNRFAAEVCSKHGHVVGANGFQPDFSIKDLLLRIQSLPPLQDLPLSASVEKQAHQIVEHLSSISTPHIYIVIHSIDAAPLRTTRSKTVLSVLASTPRIHLIASIDHINAPLLWSSSELSARKPSSTSTTESAATAKSSIPSSSTRRGFSWLWHDLTTLEPYDVELSFVDRSSITGASSAARSRKADLSGNAQNTTAMTETAANHILASVTVKAKKLFVLLGKRQLASIEDGADGKATGGGNDLQQHGTAYDVLFSAARDEFVASNDTAFRSVLGEFRDHELIKSAPGPAGAEILWIPLRKERLASVLAGLEANSG